MYSPQALACTREPGLPIFLPQWQERGWEEEKQIVSDTWGDTEEFKQRFMKWKLVEAVLPRLGAARGCGTWLSLRPAAIGPAKVPFLAQVFISEWTALNVSGPILGQRQTLYFP